MRQIFRVTVTDGHGQYHFDFARLSSALVYARAARRNSRAAVISVRI